MSSWNAFRKQHAGQGYTMAQLSAMYRQGATTASAPAQAPATKPSDLPDLSDLEDDERYKAKIARIIKYKLAPADVIKRYIGRYGRDFFALTGMVWEMKVSDGVDYGIFVDNFMEAVL